MIPLLNPFACAFCDDSFSTPNALVSHVKIKHETINVKIEDENKNNKVRYHMVAEKDKASEDKSLYDSSTNEKLERSLSLTKVNSNIENSIRGTMPTINAKNEPEEDCESIIVDQKQSIVYNDIALDIKKDLIKIDEDELNQQSTVSSKRFSCKTCGKTYNMFETCRYHESSHRAREYSCDFCQKNYHYKQQLKIHERVHTGEKPYSCRFCDKKFSQSNAIPYHER